MFVNGYNATAIKDITERISIPKGSFYNHFENKEAFGLEVVQAYCDNGARMYERSFLDQSIPPLERMANFFTRVIANYQNELNFKLGCIMGNFSTEMSDVNENFRVLLDDEFNKLEEIVATCFQEAIDKGDLSADKDAHKLASYFLNSWHGALMRMKTTGNSKPLEDCRDMVMNILLK